ncbi:MAG: HAMP domain-containing histidine kinase [Planctomycetes bacterium]|nr:HAMP domain-containing histidine kinase [Planctomycetota bacterium]
MTESAGPEPSETNESRKRAVPRVALLRPASEPDLLAEFPGRFVVKRCERAGELDSLLLSASVDLVVVDCRESVPDAEILELLRHEGMVDYLAVGRPENRRSIPSFMRSHWCPWPVDLRSFYRLVVALARKAAWERAFRRQRKQMRDLAVEARLGRRLAQVLHELNNPLDAVMRFVRLALDQETDETAARYLGNAEVGLKRMARTLEELHRDGRQAAHELSLIELRELLREATVTCGLVESPIELSVAVPEEPLVLPQALGPVLTNLLKNAQEACHGRGHIRIEARRLADGLELAVGDDGEGFGELFKEELFRPWFKRGEGGGLGLGLHSARVAVEQLGGRLEAQSPGLGQGATFTIRLPLFEGPPEQAEEDLP